MVLDETGLAFFVEHIGSFLARFADLSYIIRTKNGTPLVVGCNYSMYMSHRTTLSCHFRIECLIVQLCKVSVLLNLNNPN